MALCSSQPVTIISSSLPVVGLVIGMMKLKPLRYEGTLARENLGKISRAIKINTQEERPPSPTVGYFHVWIQCLKYNSHLVTVRLAEQHAEGGRSEGWKEESRFLNDTVELLN